jgi:hypothetical protein
MLKKKIWASFQRITIELLTQNLSLSSKKYRVGIQNPEKNLSRIRVQGSKSIGSRIRIRNTALFSSHRLKYCTVNRLFLRTLVFKRTLRQLRQFQYRVGIELMI